MLQWLQRAPRQVSEAVEHNNTSAAASERHTQSKNLLLHNQTSSDGGQWEAGAGRHGYRDENVEKNSTGPKPMRQDNEGLK